MTVMNRVWVSADDHVIAVHNMSDVIPDAAYPGCEMFVVPDGSLLPVAKVTGEDGVETWTASRIPGGFRENYVTPIPREVSKLALRRSLRAAGKLAAFDEALAGASDEVRDDYEVGTVFAFDDAAIVEIMRLAKIKNAERDDILRRAG